MMRHLLVGMICMFIAGCSQADQGGTVKTKEIDALIRKAVPIGSSSAQVISFLDANKIEHSPYQAKERAIYGMIRDTSRSATVKGSTQIEFHFDEKAMLKDYVVKDVFTGP